MKPGDEMRAALKRIAVPYLRSVGFRGSFPHFARTRDRRRELLSFQFWARLPGQFAVNLATRPDGTGAPKNATEASPDRLTPTDAMADHWFVFDKRTAAFLREMSGAILEARTFARDYTSEDRFDELAHAVVDMFRARGDELLSRYRLPGSAG